VHLSVPADRPERLVYLDKHIFRRGHVFWWRRIHPTSDSRRLDVRLSLRTFDRLEARNRGAVLTGATGGVLRMLEQRIRAAGERPTEADLQTIAKGIYEELLSELCTRQRSRPFEADQLSAINFTMIDYFQRLVDLGGHASLCQQEIDVRREAGWSQERVNNLAVAIRAREEDGVEAVPIERIDRQLHRLGFEPNEELRWMAQLVAFEACRDAHIAAEEAFRDSERRRDEIWGGVPAISAPQPGLAVAPTSADPEARTLNQIPDEWSNVTATEAAERLIRDDPKFSPHRREGKRARSTVGEQTLRQIRWAAVLIERSMGGRPFHTLCNDDLRVLDEWFERLPVQCGKAPWHREVDTTLEAICADAEEKVEDGEYEADDIGLQVATTNKHFRKIRQTYDYMKKSLNWLPELEFDKYIAPDIKDERAARAAYTVEQGEDLFRLPPWTGCVSFDDRLDAGSQIYHDSLYFVLLLVWYTGMRREEVCKLLVSDVQEFDGIWHISIAHTEAGRVKNLSSVRLIAISDELIRLGFTEYVQAIAAAGHQAVFPELVSEREKAKKGDTFYKLWWIYIRPLVPSLKRGQAMHSARHMVDTELKDLEVFSEFRDDALGHKGKGEGPSRYSKATRLRRLQALVNQIPVVTGHLSPGAKTQLLPAEHRKPRPRRH
jgi:integrase